MPTCHQCGGTEVDYNDARGESTCMSCGTVLTEGTMVESLSFAENSAGASQMVGQFVSFSKGSAGFGNRETREQTLQRGYANIQKIADHLKLSTQHVEAARRIYVLAVQRSFTIGRVGLHVAAMCLYTICRRERTPHMLIDFADVLRVPVRTLAQVFMKLLRLLHLQVPHLDPSFFMERFAAQMDLKGKTQAVAATGVRLIQAMTRDWLCAGRRPSGLCGAALLISARYFGFIVNAEDIVHIVRISSPTLIRRLYEFRDTSTAALTVEEFETEDLTALPILKGPPCYERAKRKEWRQQVLADCPKRKERLPLPPITTPTTMTTPTTPTISPDKPSPSTECPSPTTSTHLDSITTSPVCDTDVTEKESADATSGIGGVVTGGMVSGGTIELDVPQDKLCADNPTCDDIATIAKAMMSAIDKSCPVDKAAVDASVSKDQEKEKEDAEGKDKEKSGLDRDDDEEEDPLTALLRDVRGHTEDLFSELSGIATGTTPTTTNNEDDEENNLLGNLLASFENEDDQENGDDGKGGKKVNDDDDDDKEGDETLSDVCDSDVAHFLLSEEDKEIKAMIWDELTKDVMPEVHRRLKERKRREAEALKNPTPKKRRKKEKEAYPEANTPADSVRMALERNSVSGSKRLNDDLLDSLFSTPVT